MSAADDNAVFYDDRADGDFPLRLRGFGLCECLGHELIHTFIIITHSSGLFNLFVYCILCNSRNYPRKSAARALFRLSYTSDSASVSGLTRAIQ